MIDVRDRCINELKNVHGRHVSRRFTTMLENREHAEGKSLSDKEIEHLKIQFDREIYRELIGKGGK
jgi:hypothetical protein